MNKNYELTLPAGYREAMLIDAGNKKLGILLNVIAFAITVLILILIVPLLHLREHAASVFITLPKLIVFTVSPIIYLVAHELVHGVAYKLLTGQKLTFGLTLTVAYCGVPHIYVYRRTALISLLAPFVVFSLLFGGLTLFLRDALWKLIFAILLALHVGGCAGDLYDTLLFLIRFRDPDTLMNDTGPAQRFYVKE